MFIASVARQSARLYEIAALRSQWQIIEWYDECAYFLIFTG